MEKPHLSKFVFESFDPVHEAGKQARWYGVLAEFQKGNDGVYRKVLSGELTLAQLEAQQEHPLVAVLGAIPLAAMRRAEAAEAQIPALQNEVTQARAERDRAVTRAAEQALETGRQMNDANARIQYLETQLDGTKKDLHDALGARDNFAALEKSARGEVIAARTDRDKFRDMAAHRGDSMEKIPAWLRRIFGATLHAPTQT